MFENEPITDIIFALRIIFEYDVDINEVCDLLTYWRFIVASLGIIKIFEIIYK